MNQLKLLLTLLVLVNFILPGRALAYSPYSVNDYQDVLVYAAQYPEMLQKFQSIYDGYYASNVGPWDAKLVDVKATVYQIWLEKKATEETNMGSKCYSDLECPFSFTPDFPPLSIFMKQAPLYKETWEADREAAIETIKGPVKKDFLLYAKQFLDEKSISATQAALPLEQSIIATPVSIQQVPNLDRKANWDRICYNINGSGWVSDEGGMNCVQKIIPTFQTTNATTTQLIVESPVPKKEVSKKPSYFIGQPKTHEQLLSCQTVVSKWSKKIYKKPVDIRIIRTMNPKWAICK